MKKKEVAKPVNRKMGVISAWRWLAGKWDNAECRFVDEDYCFVLIGSEYCSGLCFCVDMMRFIGMISKPTEQIMREAIKINRPEGLRIGNYYFPATLSGAKKRAEFCRKMIEYHKKIAVKPAKKMVPK